MQLDHALPICCQRQSLTSGSIFWLTQSLPTSCLRRGLFLSGMILYPTYAEAFVGTMQALSLLAAASGDGCCLKSGAMPSLSMSVSAGVRYFPLVMTMPEPSESSYTLCISPLPNVLHACQSLSITQTSLTSLAAPQQKLSAYEIMAM